MDTHNHSHSSRNTSTKQQQHWAKTYKHFGLEQTETLLSPSSSNPFRAAHQRSLVNRILGFENWIRCSRPCCRQTEGRTGRQQQNQDTDRERKRERDAAISSTLSNLPTPTQQYSLFPLPMPAAALAPPLPFQWPSILTALLSIAACHKHVIELHPSVRGFSPSTCPIVR